MKLLFAVMPWHSLDYPCLAAGILNALTVERCPGWEFEQRYLNVEWAEHLFEASAGEFTPRDYCLLSEEFVFSLAGEWVFSSALQGVVQHNDADYRALFGGNEAQFEKILFAHRQALAFVDAVADDIVSRGYDVVALSSTFTQNAACLALAKAIRRRDPAIVTMMGGGNCDGVQGVALHRNYRFVDYVVRGEGEQSWPLMLDALASGARAALADVPGLCWWRDGVQHVNESATTEDMDSVPAPEYTTYFSQVEASPIRAFLEPVLVMETARGCWWGEKHHCTFCGLNGTGMKFRSKSQERALREIEELVDRHQVLDVIVADNILDLQYFKEFLPRLILKDWDLRIHYEIKANLKPQQIDMMRRAGIAHVQPGIENLSSRVLALMDKGITGARNVQSLRDCEEANLTVSWNYLLGFPGETADDYVHIIRQIPNLVHLQPPSGATRMALERFSPHFEKPWLGFPERWPHPAYKVIYGMDDRELADFAFFFQAPDAGIDEHLFAQLQQAIDAWRADYRAGRALAHVESDAEVEIHDGRTGVPRRYKLETPLQRAAFRLTSVAQTHESLVRQLSTSHACAASECEQAVSELVDLGLLFHDSGQVVRLSTPSIPFRAGLS